jgi:hypothetical protein
MQHADAIRECERFAVAIKCAACAQVGSVAWEEVTSLGATIGGSKLISVSNGFHTDGLTPSGSPRIVCDHCDTAQSE